MENKKFMYISSLDEKTQRKVIDRLLDFYYTNKTDINLTVDIFLFESLQNKLVDLEDTIDINNLF